uniref:Pentatricopeptide repeat protein n=1 Tax=Salvia miltiorrhiza TaxID=226208 RepID=A0A678WE17_SALMI|nr:pentatricopeptide repeat protein [Salvia miltiorrhiza]
MSKRAVVSAIDLFHRRGFLNRWSHKSGIISPPFSLFSTKAFRPHRSRIDFSCVKELDDAIQLFQQMKIMRPEPSVRMYNNLMSVTAKIEQYCFALYVFDEMLRMGVPVDDYTMNIVVNCCCLLKDIYSAFTIMGFFFKSGYEPDVTTLGTLIKWLFLDNNDAEAVKLFEKVLDLKLCEPDGVMILHVIDGLCKAGEIIAAHDWLHRLESSGWRPNVWGYNALIDGFCKCGNVDDAFVVLSKMGMKGISPTVFVYNSVIKGLYDDGRLADINNLLNEMANYKISLDVATFSILINNNAYCKEGKMEEAEKMLEIMIQHNVCPNVVTYNAVIDGFCLKGEIERAKQLLDSIEERGLKPNIINYNSLLNGYCKKGNNWMKLGFFFLKFLLFEDMKAQQVHPDLHIYSTLMDGLSKCGMVDDALQLLSEMVKKGISPSVVTCNILIDGYCSLGKMVRARELFDSMAKTGIKHDIFTYNILIKGYCKAGNLDEAWRFFDEISRVGLQHSTVSYSTMMQGLIRQSSFSDGWKLFEDMEAQKVHPNLYTYNNLLDGLCRIQQIILLHLYMSEFTFDSTKAF